MKRIYLFLMIINFTICHTISAQISLTMTIAYPAPTYLGDWNNTRAGIATIILNSADQKSAQIKFRTQMLNSNGGIIATSNNASAQIYTIHSGANTFTLEKVLQIENLQFSDGVIANRIRTSGKLPSDSYQLCVQLLSGTNDAELTKTPTCRPFTQISYQLPYLLTPNDKSWLDANVAQTVITFRWSSLVPMSKDPVIYRLQVFEVREGQKPMQSLRSNQPILNVDVRGTSQYFWRPQLSFKDSTNHFFIWTVQTLDSKGIPITSMDDNNQGRSEPRVFGVADQLKKEKEVLVFPEF